MKSGNKVLAQVSYIVVGAQDFQRFISERRGEVTNDNDVLRKRRRSSPYSVQSPNSGIHQTGLSMLDQQTFEHRVEDTDKPLCVNPQVLMLRPEPLGTATICKFHLDHDMRCCVPHSRCPGTPSSQMESAMEEVVLSNVPYTDLVR